MSRTPLGYSVRLAVVRKVRRTFVECEYTDRRDEKPIMCPIPHPYASATGGGIFIGIEEGTRVLIAMAPSERPHIVGMVPYRELYFDQDGIKDAPIFSTEYPNVKSGDISFKNSVGANISLLNNGNITIDSKIGDESYDIELSNLAKALFMRTDNVYKFTEAGREIEGIVKRDRGKGDIFNDDVLNFLTGEVYSGLLTDIGRFPKSNVKYRSASVIKFSPRNPALIEKRNIVYEYANSYGVRGFEFESLAMSQITNRNLEEGTNFIKADPSSRENRRTDVLNLNNRNYNHLIEKVEGTVVDIYGNILDINRNIINIPSIEGVDVKLSNKTEQILKRAYSYMRRSVKYHFEINSRKESLDLDPSIHNTDGIAKNHSRWFVDVDGEGLTKINIPSSSETGNIPVLSRYIVSRSEEENGVGDDERDIKVLQFGAKETSNGDTNNFAGQTISNTEYAPVSVHNNNVTAGTAYHDLLNIASSILSTGGKLRNPNPEKGSSVVAPMTNELNNSIPDLDDGSFDPTKNNSANAGGRSIHANLDGSLEMSIGADTADRKSVVLDLAGGVISHYGRDRNGRSLIHQTDGDVIIQVGGPGISDDRFTDSSDTEDRPGRVEIHLNRPGEDATSQKIIIDENGITIDIKGSGVFKTTGDLTISAGGKLLLDGERVVAHGSVDSSVDGDRSIGKRWERLISRKGRHM